MQKYLKLLEKIKSGKSDKNIRFNELCSMLEKLGFEKKRIGGSHHIYKQNGFMPINLQPQKDSKAKPYQIRQVRKVRKVLTEGGLL